jgi:hypothetical protein
LTWPDRGGQRRLSPSAAQALVMIGMGRVTGAKG